jgi:hypothetical protein
MVGGGGSVAAVALGGGLNVLGGLRWQEGRSLECPSRSGSQMAFAYGIARIAASCGGKNV